ncbi:hypothetical protein BCD67_13820 [Oscillatoriales cyanobacterium USR001]|nr:hypothetical protein BCD67_13820 [Oscillatoriales cyanobacterium USR001]
MNILSRFLVLLTLVVVSWGWLEKQNFQATDLKNFFSPSSSVLVASAPSNDIPKNMLVTKDRQKLALNKTGQEIQINPPREISQISSTNSTNNTANNSPTSKIEKVINTSEINQWETWDTWNIWNNWNVWVGWGRWERWGGWNGWFRWNIWDRWAWGIWARGDGWDEWENVPTLLQYLTVKS